MVDFEMEVVGPFNVSLMPEKPPLSWATNGMESLLLGPCCWIDIQLTGWGYRLRST